MIVLPTPTYTLISEQVLGSASATVTFSSIPGTYKDLVLEIVGEITATDVPYIQFNGDTGTNYSYTNIVGDGTAASSARASNSANIGIGFFGTGVLFSNFLHIMSYANTSVNKTCLARFSAASNSARATAHLWRSNSAITSILIDGGSSANLASGMILRLWGVIG